MADESDIEYPAQYETEVLLKDGSWMRLRPIKRDDVERWLAFVSRLSVRTRYLRFHHVPALGREDAIHFCSVDYKDTFAFVKQSKTFEKISARHGISVAKLKAEFNRRVKLLLALHKKKVFGFEDIQKVINDYYKNPADVLKEYGVR